MDEPQPHSYSIRKSQGDIFTDGFEVMRLSGTRSAVIESVELTGASGLELLGAAVVGPERRLGAVTTFEVWPVTPSLVGAPVVDAIGAEITPVSRDSAGWELLLGLRVTADSTVASRAGVRVNYRIDGEHFTVVREAMIHVCTATDQLVHGRCPTPDPAVE